MSTALRRLNKAVDVRLNWRRADWQFERPRFMPKKEGYNKAIRYSTSMIPAAYQQLCVLHGLQLKNASF